MIMTNEERIIRLLLTAIDSHELDEDGRKLRQVAREVRQWLNRDLP